MKGSFASLNVWIDRLDAPQRWKFRYPMINGIAGGSLVIGDNLPPGQYAVNFMVQPDFVNIAGKKSVHDSKDSLLNYTIIHKNTPDDAILNVLRVQNDGSFHLRNLLLEDSAYVIFSPVTKTKQNKLDLQVETSVDSFFVPVLSATRFIELNKQGGNPPNTIHDTSHYGFTAKDPADLTLPGVTVTGKTKKNIEKYNEEFSSGLFQRGDARMFDGLDSDEIERSNDIFQFLRRKVPSITIMRNAMGSDLLYFRSGTSLVIPEIYFDEFKIQHEMLGSISTADIAMIKVYDPPARIMGMSANGAIAIYTKRGKYQTSLTNRYRFIIAGYSKANGLWN